MELPDIDEEKEIEAPSFVSKSNIEKKRTFDGFIIIAIAFQIIMIILYSIGIDTHFGSKPVLLSDNEFGTQSFKFYAMYQDVHCMMFIGFGFLMTFLRKYGFSALGFNFLICVYSVQFGIYLYHFAVPYMFSRLVEIDGVSIDNVDNSLLTSYKLIDGDIGAAVILISFGALLGRVKPTQLLIITLIELIIWSINAFVCTQILKIKDVGGSIIVHTFGAYFGLAISFIMGVPQQDEEDEDNASIYESDIFSMIGTLFLWLYWPSFNAYFAEREYYFMDRAFVNTVFALCGSTTSTFLISSCLKINRKKFNMTYIQNSTLAGGVIIGSIANLEINIGGVLLIGIIGGTMSSIGYGYLSDFNKVYLKIYDTCGINNLHGVPGILSALISSIIYLIHYRDPNQARLQFGGLLITLLSSIFGGLITGYIVKKVTTTPLEYYFNDIMYFIVPDDFKKPTKDESIEKIAEEFNEIRQERRDKNTHRRISAIQSNIPSLKNQIYDAYYRRDTYSSYILHEQHLMDIDHALRESWHKGIIGEYIKSIIFGGLDGIITLFAIVASISGASDSLQTATILVLGFGKLIGDGISMGIGDYLSEKAEKDLAVSLYDKVSLEVELHKKRKINEMIKLYQNKHNVSLNDAKKIIGIMSEYPEFFVGHIMMQKYEVDANIIDDNPLKNGAITFTSFIIFGTVPLLSYLLFNEINVDRLVIAIILTCSTMFGMGAIKGKYCNINQIKSGLYVMINGIVAAGSAYAIAYLLEQLLL